jgi:hypothetical protein
VSIDKVHLRKLLRLFLLRDDLRTTQVRADAKAEARKRREGPRPGGGDFHTPFWCDAKAHAGGRGDLADATDLEIEKNWRRKRLYPRLRDGFLLWWNEKRRWINEDIEELPNTIKASYGFAEIGGTVKVENLLCLKVGEGERRLVYAYFSERPALTEEEARLGLWVMSKALPKENIQNMRILDVIRGEPFSVDRYPLRGDEEKIFVGRYGRMLIQWRRFVEEFGG